jgi:hypothetical protein
MRTLPLAGLLVGLMMVPLGITRLLSDASTPGGANYGSDSNVYWDLAQNIHARHQWVYSPGLNYPGIGVRSENHHYIDNLYVLPGYPLLLSTVSRWGIETGPYALAFALYVLLSVTLWILAGRLFANAASVRTLGIWFIVYQILNPTWIVQLRAIGQDLAAAVFATLFVLWAVRSWQEHHVSLQDTFLMGISTAAAIMIKTNVLAFILPVLALLALAFWFQHRRGKASLALIGILLGLGMTALWGVHLRDLTGRFSLGANMGYGVFANYVYNSTPKEQADEQIHTLTQRFEDALQKGVPINQASMDAALNFQKISFQFIKTDHAKAFVASATGKPQGTFVSSTNPIVVHGNETLLFRAERTLLWNLCSHSGVVSIGIPVYKAFPWNGSRTSRASCLHVLGDLISHRDRIHPGECPLPDAGAAHFLPLHLSRGIKTE